MERVRARAAELAAMFGDPSAAHAFLDVMLDASEPYELGAALSIDARGSSLLLSYNPRVRRAAPRTRMLEALTRLGIDTRATRAALDRVERASVVLGAEWSGDAPTATVYLEEISRFYDDAERRAIESELASLTRVPTPSFDAPGSTYIWAIDLARGAVRPSSFKIYRSTTDTAAVTDTARAFVGPALDARLERAWIDGVAPSGWILQRRYGAQHESRLKIYKTYPYETRTDPGADREARALLAIFRADARSERALALVGDEITSVGVALAAGNPTPTSITAYWRLSAPQLHT